MPRSAPYLQRRGYGLAFRIAVPPDLRPFVGAREIVRALPTTDRDRATPLALECAARAKRMFSELRAGMTSPDKEEGSAVVPDLEKLREVARRAKHRIQVDDLKEQHQDELDELRRQHQRDLERVKLQAENEAMRRLLAGSRAAPTTMGAPTAPATPASPPGVSLSAPAPTPASAPAPAIPRPLHRLSEVLPVWRRHKNPALSTVEIYEAAIRRFEGHFPELHAEAIEKRHIREFVAWLQSEGKSAKTIQKEHGALRALLTIAEHEEWISSNPASGTLLPEAKGKKVRSYTPAECERVFSSPVFTAGARPTGCKGEAAFWIPLLMLCSGARREEIAQLATDRVKVSEGVDYLAIDPFDEDGRLKTDESKRAVPLHHELIEIGFLDFVEERRKAGGGLLFPELKTNRRGQYGAKWGDWWRRYVREQVGLTDERLHPAHSFRHLFITECRRLRFRDDYERALVGHAGGGGRKDAHDEYGEHLVPSLAAEVNRIDFRGLDLSHLRKK